MEDAAGTGEANRRDGAHGGTYTLLTDLDVDEPAVVTFGAVGERELPPGRYAYTGSAHGPGGFARIDRHRRVAAGDHDVRHWHVDYLLGHPDAQLVVAVRSPGVDAECAIARATVVVATGCESVPGVGASDCCCSSHLAFARRGPGLERAVRRAHDRARG